MRLLHTADWHVGKGIRGRSRADEHRAVLDEIVGVARDQSVDVALVAGDLYDTATPSAESDEIVYQALLGLAGAARHVVVVAGNHDNPNRLAAVRPLLERTNIHVAPRVARPEEGGILELDNAEGERLRVVLLPFVSQRGIVRAVDLMALDADKHAQKTWDPAYGAPVTPDVLDASTVSVNPTVEMNTAAWKPLKAAAEASPPGDVAFIDGVRRTDAYGWISEDGDAPYQVLFASIGAGAVTGGSRTQVVNAEVERLLVSPRPTTDVPTRAGNYAAVVSSGNESDDLSQTLQRRLSGLETRVAERYRGAVDLIFLDGPLREWPRPHAVGYIKSHEVSYLPEALHSVVGQLSAGERTPLFFMTTSWSRYSWYLRLPGPTNHAWWGIVRCEVSETLTVADARRVADRATAILPRFASSPHKDSRAPQNLYPIAGLERHLRRLLGDATFVRRSLREIR